MADIGSDTFSSTRVQIWIGTKMIKATKLDYGHKLSTEVVRRLGQQTIAARTEGDYETEEGNLEMEDAAWNLELLPLLPVNGFGNIKFPVTCYRESATLPGVMDTLEDTRIVGDKGSFEASPGVLKRALVIVYKQIVLPGGRTLNRRPGGGTSPSFNQSTSGFTF